MASSSSFLGTQGLASATSAILPSTNESAYLLPDGGAFAQPSRPQYLSSRILLVDDDPTNLQLLRCILGQAGYSHLTWTTCPFVVREFCERELPDIILLDLMMPGRDGFGVLADLEPLQQHNYLPVLMLTADASPQSRCRALAAGAKDFVTKPFNPAEVLLRVHNLLETTHLQRCLQAQNNELEQRVQKRTHALEQLNSVMISRTSELKAAQIEILERLAQAAEFHDDETGQHTRRVGEMAGHIAEALGWKPSRVELLRLAAPLHDVGKIAIPDHILLKPGPLTDEEFDIIKRHPELGARLLRNGRSALISLAQNVALTHHERFDGRGYPRQLAGEDIPMEGRIVAVADVFDILTHDQPHQTAWATEQAIIDICNCSGTQFDPRVVSAFSEVVGA